MSGVCEGHVAQMLLLIEFSSAFLFFFLFFFKNWIKVGFIANGVAVGVITNEAAKFPRLSRLENSRLLQPTNSLHVLIALRTENSVPSQLTTGIPGILTCSFKDTPKCSLSLSTSFFTSFLHSLQYAGTPMPTFLFPYSPPFFTHKWFALVPRNEEREEVWKPFYHGWWGSPQATMIVITLTGMLNCLTTSFFYFLFFW